MDRDAVGRRRLGAQDAARLVDVRRREVEGPHGAVGVARDQGLAGDVEVEALVRMAGTRTARRDAPRPQIKTPHNVLATVRRVDRVVGNSEARDAAHFVRVLQRDARIIFPVVVDADLARVASANEDVLVDAGEAREGPALRDGRVRDYLGRRHVEGREAAPFLRRDA